jgi:Zn-dependent peptidase ImmA (M78 family)
MIGDRIRLARSRAGYSLRDLATAMKDRVTAQAIGKYERGESLPSRDVLEALSKALGVSANYLMDTQNIALSGVEFRTKANTTLRERAHVEAEVLEWIERYLEIEVILDLDSAEWQCPVDSLKRPLGREDAEDLAKLVRDRWALGTDPIPNMTEVLEKQGLKVLCTSLPQRVSGFTCLVERSSSTPLPVIVVNSTFTLERRRLTMAHELAHRLIDTKTLSDKDEERVANSFAGAFLIPGKHLLNEVGNHRNALGYNELIALKRIYRVSGAALIVRLRQLQIIDDSVLTYAFQTIARGWRTQEPVPLEGPNEIGQRERPMRFERLCYRALAEGLITESKASELLRIPVSKVQAGLRGPQ